VLQAGGVEVGWRDGLEGLVGSGAWIGCESLNGLKVERAVEQFQPRDGIRCLVHDTTVPWIDEYEARLGCMN
jgi:hypothetical protein